MGTTNNRTIDNTILGTSSTLSLLTEQFNEIGSWRHHQFLGGQGNGDDVNDLNYVEFIGIYPANLELVRNESAADPPEGGCNDH